MKGEEPKTKRRAKRSSTAEFKAGVARASGNDSASSQATIDLAFDPDDRPTDVTFVEVSPSFARQTGVEHGAGRSMRETAPDQDEQWLELYGRVSLTGVAARFEQQP